MIVMTEHGLSVTAEVTVTENRKRGGYNVNVDFLDEIDGSSLTLMLAHKEASFLSGQLVKALDEIEELESR